MGRVRDRLREHYGADAIFRDIDGIPKGTRFADVISAELAACTELLVVIGPHWIDAKDAAGNRRLENPEDWVRNEVEAGLARKDLRVVPVLVGGAGLPTKDQLPPSLQPLLDWNAAWLRDDTFDADFATLVHDLGGHRRIPPAVAALGGLVVVLLIGLALVLATRGGGSASEDATATTVPTPGAAQSTSPPPGASEGTGAGPATSAPPSVSAPTPTTAPAPKRMTGGFNVAVADFSSVAGSDAAGAADAHLLAVRVADRLATDLGDSGLDVQVRGPDDVGAISGATKAERDAAAKAVATTIGADVVIDADVDFRDPTSVTTNALVSPATMASTPELGGYYSFLPISYAGSYTNVVTRQQLVSGLSGATEALAQFIRGIGYYSVLDDAPANPGLAEQAFQAALRSPSLPTGSQAGTHVFLGSLRLLRADLGGAEAEFGRAIAIDPGSTRASLGLAEVRLRRSAGARCAAGTVDRAGLDAATTAFATVSPSDIDAPGAGLKARLGQARALRCRSQAGLSDDFPAARTILRQVITDAGTEPTLREVVALAHAELALAEAPPVGTDDPKAVQASLDDTRTAAATSHRAQSRAVFEWQAGFYLWAQGDTPGATAALAEAARLDPSFAAVPVSGFRAQATGRLVPSATGAPGTVSTVGDLAFTGRDLRPPAGAGALLLGLGLALVGASRRLRAREAT